MTTNQYRVGPIICEGSYGKIHHIYASNGNEYILKENIDEDMNTKEAHLL